jgi:hypothetical protein
MLIEEDINKVSERDKIDVAGAVENPDRGPMLQIL